MTTVTPTKFEKQQILDAKMKKGNNHKKIILLKIIVCLVLDGIIIWQALSFMNYMQSINMEIPIIIASMVVPVALVITLTATLVASLYERNKPLPRYRFETFTPEELEILADDSDAVHCFDDDIVFPLHFLTLNDASCKPTFHQESKTQVSVNFVNSKNQIVKTTIDTTKNKVEIIYTDAVQPQIVIKHYKYIDPRIQWALLKDPAERYTIYVPKK